MNRKKNLDEQHAVHVERLSDRVTKLVILDRDGVINYDSDNYIKSPEEWHPIPNSIEAITRLSRWGYQIVVATNQSGIARGLFTMDTLNAIHDKMIRTIRQAGGRIEAIFVCPHFDADRCDCRKPKPGLFQQIAERYCMGLAGIPAIGDSLRDLEAAVAVKAQPILVRTGKGEKTFTKTLPAGTLVYDDLAAVALEWMVD